MNKRPTMLLLLSMASGCDDGAARRAAIEKAQTQVSRIAADLDQRTTDSGVYVRAKAGDVKETDPWGTPLDVSYSQGGVAEVVTVRSAGPDGEFHTTDDVMAQGMAANFKGVGEGIKKNAEETAAKAAKGAIRGTVEGVKESFRSKKRDRQPDDHSEDSQ